MPGTLYLLCLRGHYLRIKPNNYYQHLVACSTSQHQRRELPYICSSRRVNLPQALYNLIVQGQKCNGIQLCSDLIIYWRVSKMYRWTQSNRLPRKQRESKWDNIDNYQATSWFQNTQNKTLCPVLQLQVLFRVNSNMQMIITNNNTQSYQAYYICTALSVWCEQTENKK